MSETAGQITIFSQLPGGTMLEYSGDDIEVAGEEVKKYLRLGCIKIAVARGEHRFSGREQYEILHPRRELFRS